MTIAEQSAVAGPASQRTRVKRLGKRGRYDRKTICDIVDGGLLCHVGFLFDGHPVVIPTLCWRSGDRLYWHGSARGRMMSSVEGAEVCVTLTRFDGLVLARSAFHHSANYRSVILFGTAVLERDPEEKIAAMKAMVDSLFEGRWERLRPMSEKELRATNVMWIPIDEASAKVRQGPPADEQDFGWPVWAGVIPFSLAVGQAERDERGAISLDPAPKLLRPR